MFLTVWAKHWVTSAHPTPPLQSGVLNFSWVNLKLNTQKGLGGLQVLHILKLLMTWYLETSESLLNFFLKLLSYPENESHILDSWAIGNVEALWKTLPAGKQWRWFWSIFSGLVMDVLEHLATCERDVAESIWFWKCTVVPAVAALHPRKVGGPKTAGKVMGTILGELEKGHCRLAISWRVIQGTQSTTATCCLH